MEENEVIRRAKNGDVKVFNYLYKKYKIAVYGYFLKKVNNKSVAEDLTQEAFLKLYNNFSRFDESKYKFYTFLLANTKQVYIDHVKKSNTYQGKFENDVTSIVELTENESEPYDIDEEMLEEDIKALRELINGLCDSQRIAIEMIYFENKSYKEVAERLGKTELSVKSIVYRAKKNLRQNMKEKYPEMDERMSKKYIAKMIIMIAIGISAITGLAYATYRIYNDVINNNKYTLSELREDVPESESILTREEALDKINYYLEVLGEERVTMDELKLIRNIKSGEIYWKIGDQSNSMQINSNNGNLVAYNNSDDIRVLKDLSIEELYRKLNLPLDYDICNELNSEVGFINYAKKYGEIYNQNESVNIYINGHNVNFICVLNYKYEDKEILISKEEALKIAKDNNVEVQSIELSIENVNVVLFEYDNITYEELDYNSIKNELIQKANVDIKKVWKIIDNKSNKILIDVVEGRIFYVPDIMLNEKQVGE